MAAHDDKLSINRRRLFKALSAAPVVATLQPGEALARHSSYQCATQDMGHPERLFYQSTEAGQAITNCQDAVNGCYLYDTRLHTASFKLPGTDGTGPDYILVDVTPLSDSKIQEEPTNGRYHLVALPPSSPTSFPVSDDNNTVDVAGVLYLVNVDTIASQATICPAELKIGSSTDYQCVQSNGTVPGNGAVPASGQALGNGTVPDNGAVPGSGQALGNGTVPDTGAVPGNGQALSNATVPGNGPTAINGSMAVNGTVTVDFENDPGIFLVVGGPAIDDGYAHNWIGEGVWPDLELNTNTAPHGTDRLAGTCLDSFGAVSSDHTLAKG